MPEATRSPAQHLLDRHQGRRPLARAPPGLAGPDRRQPARRRRQGARQLRFVGLFPSAAYTTQRPSTSRWCAAGSPRSIARSGVPADSHTGKELLDVLETYPRDELLQVGADELLPVALAVLHLQERRQTRLFLRQDPTGRFWSALVYLPRDRYTTEVRLAMQQLLLERLGGTSVEYTARSTESVLARLHFVVRVPVGRRGAPQADGRRRRGAAGRARRRRPQLDRRPRRRAARPARRRGRAAARPGRRRLPGRPTRRTSPPSRPSTTSSGSTGSADGQLSLRLWTPDGRGARRAAADRLPGRAAAAAVRGAAGPAEHGRRRRRRAALRDRPDRRPADLDLRLRRGRAAGRAAAAALAARAVHRGGRPRSGAARPRTTAWARWCMLAGLNWRQVTVVRAYVQWLRQAGLPFGQDYVEQTLAAHPDVVARLVALFETRFSPERSRGRAGAAGGAGRVAARVDRRGRVAGRRPRADLAAGRRHRHPADDVLRRAARWRSSSTRPPCPTCPSRGRPARCGSARRGSWASTCASAPSPAAGCAGPTAARTCAPRCSAWSRRRW